MQRRWRIVLLGRIAIYCGEREIDRFPTQKMALLLAYLALHPRQSHPREYLIELFWPESDLAGGRNNLRNALSELRRLLKPAETPRNNVIVADKHSVRLNFQAGVTDVAEFEQCLDAVQNAPREVDQLSLLEQAISLYEGELLPGCNAKWARQERERLAGRYLDLLNQRNHLLERLGQRAAAQPLSASSSLPTASTHLPTLPLYLTRFFDRESEREQLLTWLHGGKRLITITGPGGAGKTRLAVEAAQHAADLFAGGIHFVSLAEVATPALLPSALANALHLTPARNEDPLTAVAELLAAAPSLLILDNFEHLAGNRSEQGHDCPPAPSAGETLIFRLLEQTPSLTCLVTSRCLLGLHGEQELPLLPLPLPGNAADTSAAEMLLCPSVALYADRAQEARPDFAVTDRNAASVAMLCQKLEGMPLAIEMAAAWIKLLSPARMLERLDQQITLLSSRRGDVTPRHLSLHATIEWGYDLLTAEQQRAFTWLSVFRGGWSLEAAEALLGPRALDLLAELRDHSFVLADTLEDETRYRMLETLREYAGEQLCHNGDAIRVSDLHAAYYAQLAHRAAPHLKTAEMKTWMARLNQDQENLRLAIAWYLQSETGGEAALQLCNDLVEFWRVRGYWTEGRACFQAARAHPGVQLSSLARARASYDEGTLEYQEGNYEQAVSLLHEALANYRSHDDWSGIAATLQQLGNIMNTRKDRRRAHSYFAESVEIFRKLQDWSQYYYGLFGLSVLALQEGKSGAARDQAEQCLTFVRTQQKPEEIAAVLSYIGKVASIQGDDARAEAFYLEALTICRELNMRQGIATVLCNLALLSIAQNKVSPSRPLLEESLSICRELNYRYILSASLYGLGRAEAEAGNLQAARDCWQESVQIRRKLQLSLVPVLMQLAHLAYRQGDWVQAAQCYGTVQAHAEPDDLPGWPSMRRHIDAELAELSAHLGAEAFQAAFDRGAAMEPDVAVEAAFARL